jgi:hypothetical protein
MEDLPMEDDLFSRPPEKTLRQAQDEFKDTLKHKHKAICLCCERPASIVKRTMNVGYARAMIAIFHEDRLHPGWIHLLNEFDYKTLGGDYGKLRHWGLVESKVEEENDDKGDKRGSYRITEKGKAFVLNQLKVRDHLFIYRDAPVEIEGDTFLEVSIKEVVNVRFDYDELMKQVKSAAM